MSIVGLDEDKQKIDSPFVILWFIVIFIPITILIHMFVVFFFVCKVMSEYCYYYLYLLYIHTRSSRFKDQLNLKHFAFVTL